MVGIDSVGAHDKDDGQDAEEGVDQAPPGVVRVFGLNVCDDGAHKSNDPAGLSYVSVIVF